MRKIENGRTEKDRDWTEKGRERTRKERGRIRKEREGTEKEREKSDGKREKTRTEKKTKNHTIAVKTNEQTITKDQQQKKVKLVECEEPKTIPNISVTSNNELSDESF